jgi:hypothetical protein
MFSQGCRFFSVWKHSPSGRGHFQQLHGINFFDSLQEGFADTVHSIQNVTFGREDDGIGEVRFINVPRVLCDVSAGRSKIQRPSEPTDFIKAFEVTNANLLHRQARDQRPKLIHAPKTHRAVCSRRRAGAAARGALVVGLLFILVHKKTLNSLSACVFPGSIMVRVPNGHEMFWMSERLIA